MQKFSELKDKFSEFFCVVGIPVSTWGIAIVSTGSNCSSHQKVWKVKALLWVNIYLRIQTLKNLKVECNALVMHRAVLEFGFVLVVPIICFGEEQFIA